MKREIKQKIIFKAKEQTFSAKWEAEHWLRENGYSFGSTDGGQRVAIVKGEYNLPQKLKNFSKEDYQQIDGYIYSTDYRQGDVEVWLFDDSED